MFEITAGLHGKVLLTVTDSRGNVVLHETVKPHDAEEIAERTLANIRG